MKDDVEKYISDIIMGRPYVFSVGDRNFALYPVTMGKMCFLQDVIERMDINEEMLAKNVSYEALRLVREKKEDCLRIICCHVCRTKEELFDSLLFSERMEFFKKELDDEDITALMIIALTSDKSSYVIKESGIDKEQDLQSMVSRVKDSKNNLVFGGKTQFGVTIDAACERYGWTKDYVVWGIDYASLRLMLADKINSIYVTDEEFSKLPAEVRFAHEDVIKPTKENMETILSMDWK